MGFLERSRLRANASYMNGLTKYLLMGMLVLASGPSKTEGVDNCGRLRLFVDQSDKKEIEVEVEGGIDPVYYIFFYPNGKLVDKNRDLKSGVIKNLVIGKYVCAVESGCTKRIEFEVE
jgi:hypothetical protein